MENDVYLLVLICTAILSWKLGALIRYIKDN